MQNEEFFLANPACLSVPVSDADQLLRCGNSDCAVLYLYLLRAGRPMSVQRAAEDLRLNVKAVQTAGQMLKKYGLLGGNVSGKPKAPVDELPEYDAKYVATRTQQDPAFRDLLREAANILGRVLSTQDTKTLFGIYDTLGLPPEVLMILMTALTEEYQEKYGTGRFPTMRAVEKEAYVWARQEIFTYEQAEALLEHRAQKKELITQLKQGLGIRDRELSKTEREYVASWIEKGFGLEALLIAYDRTVTQTGGLRWQYMNKIIESWQEKGLHTPEEITEGDTLPSRKTRPGEKAPAQPQPSAAGQREGLQKFLDSL
ncbi:MAG: DnaD domain protein [Oscillospiraceae bacterium]|nr:DnaD domain protein [Oscillospiraceae bacterium]